MGRSFQVDNIDRSLLAALQQDAGLSYARLGETVGLAAASAHDRVRKLREHGVITGSTITLDPGWVGRDVLAFVTLTADAWVGDARTRDALAAIPEVEGAYVVAGNPSLMVKVRATTNPISSRCCDGSTTSTGSPAPSRPWSWRPSLSGQSTCPPTAPDAGNRSSSQPVA